MFECADGTYCSETDAACCVARGGRVRLGSPAQEPHGVKKGGRNFRCPASTPFMCQNTMDCANSQAFDSLF